MRGRDASATAISSRRCSPCDRKPASSSALPVNLNCASSSSTRCSARALRERGRRRPWPCSRYCTARRRFSRTGSSKTRLVIWNERDRPAASILWGGRPVTSRPSKCTVPALGRIAPLIRLNRLLLPAPLGPITAVICPARASKLKSCTARSAPNCTLKPLTQRTALTWRPSLPGPARTRGPGVGKILEATDSFRCLSQRWPRRAAGDVQQRRTGAAGVQGPGEPGVLLLTARKL